MLKGLRLNFHEYGNAMNAGVSRLPYEGHGFFSFLTAAQVWVEDLRVEGF